MRQNLMVALLSASCTLLAVNLYVSLREPQLPLALGQSATSGSVVIATGVTTGGSETMAYIYDAQKERLAAYTVKGNTGLELKGVRNTSFDFKIPVQYPPNGKPSPTDIKKAIGSAAGAKEEK